MLWVRLESIYTETDRFGNTRRWENRLEASGSGDEVIRLLERLSSRKNLPGFDPIVIPGSLKGLLLEE